jgi:hypothetical protein
MINSVLAKTNFGLLIISSSAVPMYNDIQNIMMGQACGKKHPALSAFSVNGNK